MTQFHNIRAWAALLIAGAAFAACQPDEPQQETPKTYTMTVLATKGSESDSVADGSVKRALSLTGKTLKATWDEGEVVEVYQSGSKIGELTAAASATASTTLTGSFGSAPSTSADLTFYFHTADAPSYSGQDGTLEKLASTYDFCAPATVTTGNFTVDDVNKTISVPDGISFGANQQAIVKFTLKNSSDAAINASFLRINDGDHVYYIYPSTATDVLYVALPGFSDKTVKLEASIAGKLYKYARNSVTFSNSQYYEIGVKMTEVPGALAGRFTIHPNGKQVHFSQGNLQATTTDLGANWTWSFAEHQWDFIGGRDDHISWGITGNNYINGNGTMSQNGTIDLFGWVGASSNFTGAAQYGISNSTSNDDYGNVADEHLKSDWGTLAITNGGNTSNSGWYTPNFEYQHDWNKHEGWDCIILERTSGSVVNDTTNALFAYAKITDIGYWNYGLILFPDNITIGAGAVTKWGIINHECDFDEYATQCTSAEWAALEAIGCVFLPRAGARWGSDFESHTCGFYWSSTSLASPTSEDKAWYLDFNDIVCGTLPGKRLKGCSVRLVRDAD